MGEICDNTFDGLIDRNMQSLKETGTNQCVLMAAWFVGNRRNEKLLEFCAKKRGFE